MTNILKRRPRRGFSLVELMITMSMLAIVMSSLGGLALMVAKRGKANDIVTKRNFVLQQQANRLGAMSFNNLALQSTGSSEMTVGDFSFTRRLTLTSSTNRYEIKVVIVPARDTMKKDSLTFDRTRPFTGTPLCTNC